MSKMYRVNGSRFIIELLDDGDGDGTGTVIIWDTTLEDALREWMDQGMPMEMRPPFPIVASGISEGEAFDWLREALGLDHPYIPVTRIQ